MNNKSVIIFLLVWGLTWGLLSVAGVWLKAPGEPVKSELVSVDATPEMIALAETEYDAAEAFYADYEKTRIFLLLIALFFGVALLNHGSIEDDNLLFASGPIAGFTIAFNDVVAVTATHVGMLPTFTCFLLIGGGIYLYRNRDSDTQENPVAPTSQAPQSTITNFTDLPSASTLTDEQLEQCLSIIRQALSARPVGEIRSETNIADTQRTDKVSTPSRNTQLSEGEARQLNRLSALRMPRNIELDE
jgi:hypothetical protein